MRQGRHGFLLGALCLWRITHLLYAEEGPFDAMTRLRLRAGDLQFGKVFDCFNCLSLWLAIPIAIVVGESWGQRLVLWPALSGAACLLEQATVRSPFPGIVYEEPTRSDDVL
jgi:hypothetical protein